MTTGSTNLLQSCRHSSGVTFGRSATASGTTRSLLSRKCTLAGADETKVHPLSVDTFQPLAGWQVSTEMPSASSPLLDEHRKFTDDTGHLLSRSRSLLLAGPRQVDLHRHRRDWREIVLVVCAEDRLRPAPRRQGPRSRRKRPEAHAPVVVGSLGSRVSRAHSSLNARPAQSFGVYLRQRSRRWPEFCRSSMRLCAAGQHLGDGVDAE